LACSTPTKWCGLGIEGSGHFGRAVAVHLLVCWQSAWSVAVVEVPTLMTSRERRGQLGKGKTDPVDALAIARITARELQLPPVRLTVGAAADLRAVLDYREDLVVERGALVNRAHAELSGLRAGYHHQVPNLTTRARVRVVLTLIAEDDSVRAVLCRRRLERILAIDAETAELKRQITDLVAAAGTTLTDLYGIGPLVAARFIAEVVDVRRYPDRNAFAAANGTAPLPASSGRTVRHRFNPGGKPATQPRAL
jgi:transposase